MKYTKEVITINKNTFYNQIKAASKKINCDLVIKNITIVDVFSQDTFINNVAIKNGYIVGIGDYDGEKNIDGTGKFICPSFIDSHAHIESSLSTPYEYSKAALLHGITTVIADPHEIANVLGVKGIDFMLNCSSNLPLDFFFQLPSCVPATPFENSGATLYNDDLKPFYNSKRILGLAEVMDFPSVSSCRSSMIDKLLEAKKNNKRIDGHGAGILGDNINIYATADIKTDHECSLASEALDKLKRGIYILIREGTSAKNLKELLPIINEKNSRRICFCTDDKHIDDLINLGSIDYCVRYSINEGINPATAIQIASLNAAECYNLNHLGAIAPGYKADFLILNDLNNLNINQVYKNGKLIVDNNKLISFPNEPETYDIPKNTINIPYLDSNSFSIDIKDKSYINVIKINPNKLETNHLKISTDLYKDSNLFYPDIKKDLLKVAIIERHNNTGNIGLGILNGLNLKEGAIATTIAHDSHNLIVCGTNDSDMIFAVESLKKLGGGIIIVNNNKILASVQLEIAGLMTNRNCEDLLHDLKQLHTAINSIAPNLTFNPFLTLSFISLPVIPEIKITDKGLFDVLNFKFIPTAE